jgi:hypothetical protein
MPVTRKVPPLPDWSIPIIDPETGRMTPPWYQFFQKLLAVIAEAVGLIP